jgi:hypothetical protein
MTQFFGDVRDLRRENLTRREFPTAEVAAENLFVLMRLDGWTMSQRQTVAILKTGQVLRHKNFAYKVATEGA